MQPPPQTTELVKCKGGGHCKNCLGDITVESK